MKTEAENTINDLVEKLGPGFQLQYTAKGNPFLSALVLCCLLLTGCGKSQADATAVSVKEPEKVPAVVNWVDGCPVEEYYENAVKADAKFRNHWVNVPIGWGLKVQDIKLSGTKAVVVLTAFSWPNSWSKIKLYLTIDKTDPGLQHLRAEDTLAGFKGKMVEYKNGNVYMTNGRITAVGDTWGGAKTPHWIANDLQQQFKEAAEQEELAKQERLQQVAEQKAKTAAQREKARAAAEAAMPQAWKDNAARRAAQLKAKSATQD